MTTTTLTRLAEHTGMRFDPHLEHELDVPVITEAQAQGDIYVVPAGTPGFYPAPGDPTPLPDGRFDVIEGQGIRNPHTLIDLDRQCTIVAGTAGYPFDVATLTVPPGGVCWLIHPEHGANGIGPGTYVVRRQREQAEEVRAVAD